MTRVEDYTKYRNEKNLKTLSMIMNRKFFSKCELADTLCSATHIPIFVCYRLLSEFLQLEKEDYDRIRVLDKFYNAKVINFDMD